MRLLSFVMILFSLPVVHSCRTEPDYAHTQRKHPASLPSEVVKFDSPVMLFIYPDRNQTDSLTAILGNDRFYTQSDSAGEMFRKARKQAERKNLQTWSGTVRNFEFTTSDGAVIELRLSAYKEPWFMVTFDGQNSPQIVRSADIQRFSEETEPLKIKTGRKIKSTTQKSAGAIAQSRDSLVRAEIPDIETRAPETTIRLQIYPGAPAPPYRNESAGIRIISSYISAAKQCWLEFDNDLFSNTDRYYTNGVVLGYSAPSLTSWKLNRLMIGLRRNSVIKSAISLHHGMYTPFTTKLPPTLNDDRPYASTLFLRYSQVSEDALSGIRVLTALEAGVIGDAALGRYLQKSVHAGIPSNDEPLGWDTQIRNDVVLNYHLGFHKQVVSTRSAEVYATSEAVAGTLHTRGAIGITAIAGRIAPGLTPLPGGANKTVTGKSSWHYGAEGGFEMRFIGYDATLQGGFFSKENIYALKPEEIERLVAALHFGLFAGYGKFGLSISQYYLSPEFKAGKQHFWGQIGLKYGY